METTSLFSMRRTLLGSRRCLHQRRHQEPPLASSPRSLGSGPIAVMATDATPGTSGSNLEERLALLEAALAQKDAEITALRARTAQNPPPTVEVPPVVYTTAPATKPTTLIPEEQMITEPFKALQLDGESKYS